MSRLLFASLVLFVGYASGAEREQAELSKSRSLSAVSVSCACPELELLRRTVGAACATPAVAALPQMAVACTLASAAPRSEEATTRPGGLKEAGIPLVVSNQTKSRLEASASVLPPHPLIIAHRHQHPVPMSGMIDGGDYAIPAWPNRHHRNDRPRRGGHIQMTAPKTRRRRAASSCSPESPRRSTVLESLQAYCAVPGCMWLITTDISADREWFESDLNLTCADATAIAAVPFNYTCPFLMQPCRVEIQLNLVVRPTHLGSLQNAAMLLGNWQNNVSVTLRGQWGEQGLSAVLQHTHTLERLDARSAGFTALSSKALAKLTSLRKLSLWGNNMHSIHAGAFSTLTQLVALSLRDNELEALPSQLFHNCSRLSFLYLEMNKLTKLDAELFHGLSLLESLTLYKNQLTRVPAGVFQGLSTLSSIYLYKNKLSDIDATTFHGVSALEFLDLGLNQLTQLPSAVFKDLPHLTTFFIDKNELQDVDTAAFQALPALQTLYLSNNRLNRLQGGIFVVPPELGSLSELLLDATGISSVHLPANITLAYLTVAYNRDLTSVALAAGARVAVADVSGTALRIADLPCELFGYKGLVARSMKHTTSLDLLKKCMGPDRESLDVSDNGEDRVSAVRQSLSTEAGRYSLGSNESLHLYPENSLVRNRPVSLTLVSSPVQCSIGPNPHPVITGNYYVAVESLQMFSCNCIPGYYESDGTCQKEIPFVAKPEGIITVVLTTLLVAGLLVLCQKRFKKSLRHARHDLEMQRSLLEYAETEVLALKRVWEIDAEEVALVKRIDGDSEGAFGAVWRGDWDGMVVAVKVLRAGLLELDSKLADEFDREADFLMRARHSNVVRFFGAGRMPGGEPFVVLELVSRGSLRGLLRGDKGSQLDDALKQRLALDVARGMAYIHSLGALHRDLKSGNVLVTENWRGKVADFGSMRTLLASAASVRGPMSRVGDAGLATTGRASSAMPNVRELTLTAGVGTPLYMALEVLRGDDYGDAADVWAFGVMVWELVEERSPDLLVETGQDEGRGPLLGRLLNLLEAGKRLQLEASAPAWAQRVVIECMLAEASERPSFAALKDQLTVAG